MFKSVDHIKTTQQQDETKPKYNLVCIGSTKDQKNRMILSERVQNEHSWTTDILTKAPLEIQKKIKQIAIDKPTHKRMLTMSSKISRLNANRKSNEKSLYLKTAYVVNKMCQKCQPIKLDLMMAYSF